MSFKVSGAICAIAVWFSFNTASAQQYHQLTIDDFAAPSHQNNSSVIAYTNCTIGFSYQATRRNGYYSLDCTVRLILNTDKSWMDKRRVTSPEMLAEILKHEQGHYNIAYLEQQELLRAVSRTLFGENYKAQASSLFSRIDARYKQLNEDYDDDTQHMLNRVQQVSWDNYFKRRLNFMPQA